MIIMIFLLLICAICGLCAYIFWRRVAIRLNEPPVYPGAWPVIGHALSVIGHERLWKTVREFAIKIPRGGGVMTYLVGPVKIYIVCSPKESLIIANQCLDKSHFYKFGTAFAGNSLLVSNSVVWKKDRKMLMPAFSHHALGSFLDAFNREARRVVEKLSTMAGKGSFDHIPYINEYAMDTLCNTVLDLDISLRQEYVHSVETYMQTVIKRLTNVFLHSDTIYEWSNLKKLEDNCTIFLNNVADEIIQRKKYELERKTQYISGKKSFVDIMLQTEVGEMMTTEQMRGHLNVIIGAGYDTIALTMAVILVMIGSYENVQEKVNKEINEVFGDTSKDVALEDLDRLVYLEAVIKESMRLYPPVPAVGREIKEDIKLENYTLYAGHSVLLVLSGLNLHPMWGDDALEFRPERWLDPATLPDHPAVYAPFCIGRRYCIGKYYAMMSMKTFLVHIIRNYVIDADCRNMKFSLDILSRLESGQISLQRRT